MTNKHIFRSLFNPYIYSIILGFSIAGCGSNSNEEMNEVDTDDISIALTQMVNENILPTVEGFSQKSERFKLTADDFCNSPDASKLAKLQADWRSLSSQWYQLAIYNFGPLDDDVIFPKINFIDSLRQRGIDYTDTVRIDILDSLANNAPLNTSFFESKDFNRVGLLALELVTFETTAAEDSTLPENIVTEYQATPKKCEYLKGMAAFNISNANYVKDSWQTSYKGSDIAYKNLFAEDRLEDEGKSIPTLLVSLQQHLDYLGKRNVVVRGAKVSNYSYENIKASIDEINLVLNGSANSTVSLFDVMISKGAENSVQIVKDNVEAIFVAIEDKNETQLNADLALLDGNFKREIPEGLDIELGINFTDGD